MEPKLSIELVPSTAFYANVRQKVSTAQWDVIRKKCYKAAKHKCEICGGSGRNQGKAHPVECHEVWYYDETTQVQKLKGFIALCPRCHMVKHFGLARVNGLENLAKEHLARINQWSHEQVNEYIAECWTMWQYRSKIDWKLDITYISAYLDEPKNIPTYKNPDAEIW